VKKFYTSKVPMQRGCTTADVMKAIYYLVEQEYETGQALPVDRWPGDAALASMFGRLQRSSTITCGYEGLRRKATLSVTHDHADRHD